MGGQFGGYENFHFSGNFWWARADHVAALPSPLDFMGPGALERYPNWLGSVRHNQEFYITYHVPINKTVSICFSGINPMERHLHRFPASHYTTSNDSAVCGGVPVLGPTVESAVESARHVCATGGARIFVSAAEEKGGQVGALADRVARVKSNAQAKLSELSAANQLLAKALRGPQPPAEAVPRPTARARPPRLCRRSRRRTRRPSRWRRG